MLKWRFLICLLALTFFCIGQPLYAAEKPPLSISINVPARTLSVYRQGALYKIYPVGVGKPESQTPLGEFFIQSKEVDPTWISPSDLSIRISSGPDNPLGYRWMELEGVYGIHGTNRPESIGGFVSNGCIRMQESDVEELFDMVSLGTPVKIEYQRLFVQKNRDGSVYMTLYSDAYGKAAVTLDDIRKALEAYEVNDLVSDGKLKQLLNAADGRQVKLVQVYPVYVMGKLLQDRGIVAGGVHYIPVSEAARTANVVVDWNGATATLTGVHGTAQGFVHMDKVYVNSDYAYRIFGTYVNWRDNREAVMLDEFPYQ